MWPIFHKLGSPKWFYTMSGRWLPFLWGLSALAIAIGSVWGLAFAPPDYQQGDSFRIIYVHVPAAIVAQSCLAMMALCSLIFLVWRIKLADMVAGAAAPFGAAMTFSALFSGAIWGVPTWGTWWVWDARLTSMLLLLFIYLGIMALRGAFATRDGGARAAAILTLVGVINLPIIKYSVVWWNTLHQGATFSITEKPAMPASMWLPLLVMVVGFYLFFAAVTVARTRNEIIRRQPGARWVRELARGRM